MREWLVKMRTVYKVITRKSDKSDVGNVENLEKGLELNVLCRVTSILDILKNIYYTHR